MWQLNFEANSVLSDPFHSFEKKLLPNHIIMINIERDQ